MSFYKNKSWLILLLLASNLFANVVINEVNYEAEDRTDLIEFIELYNNSSESVNLTGWYFDNAIEYKFLNGVEIAPFGFLVVAQNSISFSNWFGFMPAGQWLGKLSNSGETIELYDNSNQLQDLVDYKLEFPWPIASGGDGPSMELINPNLDNELGSSWRASNFLISNASATTLIDPYSSDWFYRKGTSEPTNVWNSIDFTMTSDWLTATTPIGFGDGDDNTLLYDMQDRYSSIYCRHAFELTNQIPTLLNLELYVDDGCIVWINGKEVARMAVSSGEKAFDALAFSHECEWEAFTLRNANSYLQPGTNVIAVHALNTTKDSSDFSIDLKLSSFSDITGPTPGSSNNTWVANAPPNIRQVKNLPEQPMTNTPVTITAKITDANGVSQATLYYQIVKPGNFIPAYLPVSIYQLHADYTTPRTPNPDFENPANWRTATMYDDGQNNDLVANDGIFTASLPAQSENRTLVRYRIQTADLLGNSIRAPFTDDPSLNFAYYVYNGVPAYQATDLSVNGAGFTHSKETMNAVPVYSLITRNRDFEECWAYDKADRIGEGIYGGSRGSLARWVYNWEGAFFYNGKVYDHIDYRLAGSNSRYFFKPRKTGDSGFESNDGYKRSMRIKFKRGNHCQFHDQYGQKYKNKWRILSVRKGFSFSSYSHYGMNEIMNTRFAPLTGIPCQKSHFFHLRVVDGATEAPTSENGQYFGDFYGMFMAFERYDSKFLDANDLPDGNLYKHTDYVSNSKEQQRVQGTLAVQDGDDYDNIANNMLPEKSQDWIKNQINSEECYRYWTVCTAVGHNDIWPVNHNSNKSAKNMVWFFEPSFTNPLGKLNIYTYDTDLSWGPTTKNKGDESYIAVFDNTNKFEMQLEYRNYLREFLDLIWTEEVINNLIDGVYNPIKNFHKADRDRWRRAPIEAGSGDYGTLEEIKSDMFQFAFIGGNLSSYLDEQPAGGRRAFLEDLANQGDDEILIPSTPTIEYYGPQGYPADQLRFVTSAFLDPQGFDTFAAMQWRIGAVDDMNSPDFDIYARRNFEAIPIWESPELTQFNNLIVMPNLPLNSNLIYRVRVRMKDDTGRWSHWSEPHQFKAGKSVLASSIVVSEIMYHPEDSSSTSTFENSDFEFIELYNYSDSDMNLRGVSFSDGIDFYLSNNYYLPANDFALVVRNTSAFASRYSTNNLNIIGTYPNKLSNGGEQIILADSGAIAINQFSYSDEWYPETDGQGYSLTLSNLDYTNQNLNLKSSWQTSFDVGGTPGFDPSVPEPSSIGILFLTLWFLRIKSFHRN